MFRPLVILCALVTTAEAVAAPGVRAIFRSDGINVRIKGQQLGNRVERSTSVWDIRVKNFDAAAICESGELNWHVHEFDTPNSSTYVTENAGEAVAACGAANLGGHYDPTLACGAPSEQQRNGNCDRLDPPRSSAEYGCSTSTQYLCDMGDLSGKMGRIVSDVPKVQLRDFWSFPVQNYVGRSMVLHCCTSTGCSARVACTSIQQIDSS